MDKTGRFLWRWGGVVLPLHQSITYLPTNYQVVSKRAIRKELLSYSINPVGYPIHEYQPFQIWQSRSDGSHYLKTCPATEIN